MAMKVDSLEALFVDNLRDLYDAEHQLIEALPKMAQAANSQELKRSFERHLDVTKQQAQRLEQVFTHVKQQPKRKKCVGMEGLIREGQEIIKEAKSDADTRDAGIIAAAQKVEHYEISGYGTARAYAEMLGHNEAARLLSQTLQEESQTDEMLNRLAMNHINVKAMS